MDILPKNFLLSLDQGEVRRLIGAVTFGSWINRVILGLVVTFGGGYLLYQLGRYF